MTGASAVDELEELLRHADPGEAHKAVIAGLCEIIVEGQKTGYLFYPDQEGGYVAMRVCAKGKETPVGSVYPDTTSLLLLNAAKLIETGTIEIDGTNYVVMRPTKMALGLYQKMKKEGKLDTHGRADCCAINLKGRLFAACAGLKQ